MNTSRILRGLALLWLPAMLSLAGCGGGSDGSGSTTGSGSAGGTSGGTTGGSSSGGTSGGATTTTLSLPAQVGEKMFVDSNLSGSGKMSCATCHDPASNYGPPNNLAVQLGGTALTTPGTRAVPSLKYKDKIPPYADLLDNPDGVSVPGPGGGFTWDGRADTLAAQAQIPLLSSNEMANASAANVVAKLQASSYAGLIEQAFGSDVFSDTTTAFNDALQAIQAYQLEDADFHPYSSKFDLYAGNKIGGNLTAAETRGLSVFTDANTGNCAACHYQGAGLNGSSALFTDFSFEAISVPRNAEIPADADASYEDIGLCGPLRTDHPTTVNGAPSPYCGMFKTPTLRNVATRSTFFHNGVMHSLEQVIRFYNTRDTNPEIWYPTVGGTPKATPDAGFPTYGLITTQYVGGTVQKFNDLPAQFLANIDTQLPLDGRAAGSATPMSEQNIADLICFLNTLNDDYKVPATAPTSGSCID